MLLYPVAKSFPITQLFGENPKWYPLTNGHNGIDWGIPEGTPVKAAASGTVTRAEMDKTGYGMHVRIDHGDQSLTIYGHLSGYAVKVGQNVRAGDVIGYSGNTGNSTGPHLHFEFRIHNVAVDPMVYLTTDETPDEQKKPIFRARVAVDSLNVRSGPGTNFPKVGSLKKGEEVEVIGLGGEQAWVQIGPGRYVAAKYDSEDYIEAENL